MLKIAPSLLSADFGALKEETVCIENAGADYLHIDVMDGCFVPNLMLGTDYVKQLRKLTNIPLDVHLMIVEPEKYVARFVEAGADYVTFHYEATNNILLKA